MDEQRDAYVQMELESTVLSEKKPAQEEIERFICRWHEGVLTKDWEGEIRSSMMEPKQERRN